MQSTNHLFRFSAAIFSGSSEMVFFKDTVSHSLTKALANSSVWNRLRISADSCSKLRSLFLSLLELSCRAGPESMIGKPHLQVFSLRRFCSQRSMERENIRSKLPYKEPSYRSLSEVYALNLFLTFLRPNVCLVYTFCIKSAIWNRKKNWFGSLQGEIYDEKLLLMARYFLVKDAHVERRLKEHLQS